MCEWVAKGMPRTRIAYEYHFRIIKHDTGYAVTGPERPSGVLPIVAVVHQLLQRLQFGTSVAILPCPYGPTRPELGPPTRRLGLDPSQQKLLKILIVAYPRALLYPIRMHRLFAAYVHIRNCTRDWTDDDYRLIASSILVGRRFVPALPAQD